jgi:type IV pilus assembly protein PilB
MKQTFLTRFIDYLLDQHKFSLDEKQSLLSFSDKSFDELQGFLLEKKIMDIEEITRLRGETVGVPYVNLLARSISHEIFEFLSADVVENYEMVAFEREGAKVSLGMVNPEDYQAIEALDFISKKFNVEVKIFIISRRSFENALSEYKTLSEEVEDVMDVSSKTLQKRFEKGTRDPEELEAVLKEAPITKIVSVIMKHAVEAKASDIHIEPMLSKTRVRYRIDGILHTALSLPRYIHPALVARVKVMANLKLDETRIPQDGRMRSTVNDREVDFRVSTLPLNETEKAVLRILETGKSVPTLQELGFNIRYQEMMQRHLSKTHGIFLATGPTGSGKTTTLYALLNMLNKEGVNIVTLEDPIEYSMEGVNQSQVRSEVNYDFASGLRSILRQDPNIIMVGEIRDHETANMAVNAGLTGHLLFSTIHTNNAAGAIPRMIDMGIEPFLIASTLNLVIAQRLTRKICTHCKEKEELSSSLQTHIEDELRSLPKEVKAMSASFLSTMKFSTGKGCNLCNHTGYMGRIAIAEIIHMTESFQRIIYNGYRHDEVEQELKSQGMVTLKQDGLLRALEGVTSVEEVLRVTEE